MGYLTQRVARLTPTERAPLTFDFGSAGALPAGETIASVAGATITPPDELLVQSVGLGTESVDVWVTGGTVDQDYIVDVEVVTSPSSVRLAASGLVQVRTR